MIAQGGCYCGAVRYEVNGAPFHRTLCHCADCRRIAGAPAVAWFSVPPRALGFTAGVPAAFRSSEHVPRGFCSTCGTTLTFQDARRPEEIDVATCSLDDPDLASPQDHTYARSRLDWLRTCDGLPEYATMRAADQNE